MNLHKRNDFFFNIFKQTLKQNVLVNIYQLTQNVVKRLIYCTVYVRV